MSRDVIRGETVPLERFPDEFKRRASLVSARALELSLTVPTDATQILGADVEDLRVAQLRKKLTYAELDAWAERLIRNL